MLIILREIPNTFLPIEVTRENYETIKKTCKKAALLFGATIGLGISTSYTALIGKMLIINNQPTLFVAFIPSLIIATSALSALGSLKCNQLAEDFVTKIFVIKNGE
jgi:hypothetical protein